MYKNNNRSNRTNNKVISKINKKKEAMNKPVNSKRLIYIVLFIAVLLLILIIRIAYFQFIKGGELRESASRQQATSRIISPNRGAIYDSSGKVLAQSASVNTITINPSKIKNNIKDVEERKEKEKEEQKLQEKLAKAFADIFELDYNEVLEKVTSNSSIETIVKKVEQDKVNELKDWMKENKVSAGINIDPDVKRYYPYGNLVSGLIGFCDTDNNGQEGIELKWNNVLSGTPGRITTIENASSGLIPDKNETYVAAENGFKLLLKNI